MTTLNKQTTKIFHDLISYLNGSDYVKIDNSKSFMPLSIDLLQTNVDFAARKANIYALAHNFEQNGDLVPDPDMTFAALENGRVYPLTIQNQFGYKEAIFIKNGDWVVNEKELRDQVNFANIWLKNIKAQQGIKPQTKAPAETPETSPAPEIEPATEPPPPAKFQRGDLVTCQIFTNAEKNINTVFEVRDAFVENGENVYYVYNELERSHYVKEAKMKHCKRPPAKFEKGEKVYVDGDQTKYYTVESSDIDPDNNNFIYSIVGNGQNFLNVPETDLQKITTDLQPGDQVIITGSEFIYRGGKAKGPKNPYYGKTGTVSHIAGVYVFINLQINKKETICVGFTPEKIFLMKRAEAPAPVEVLQPEPAPVDCEHDFTFYDIAAPAPVETPAKLPTAPAKRKKAPRQPIAEKISTFVTTLENLICDFYGVNTVSISI